MSRITFRFEPDKFVQAATHLLSRVGPCTRLKIAKLLYLADRHHLVRHGAPILGDRYYRLPLGPVPSRALDLLEAAADLAAGDPEISPDPTSEDLCRLIEIRNPQSRYAEYVARDGFMADALSPSEIASLAQVAERYGAWTAIQLKDLTHRHRAWLETAPSQEMDYRLFFADEPEADPEALSYLEFSQDDRALLENF